MRLAKKLLKVDERALTKISGNVCRALICF